LKNKTVAELSNGIDIPTKYAQKEWLYGDPFAEASLHNSEFRQWVIERTPHKTLAKNTTVLANDMLNIRSNNTQFWWRSFVCSECECQGCRNGKETDLLLIIENSENVRFAIHVEVKHPWDIFSNSEQPSNYSIRANCWLTNAGLEHSHRRILRHDHSSTLLLCSENRLDEYGSNAQFFDSLITFQEVKRSFPMIYNDRLVQL